MAYGYYISQAHCSSFERYSQPIAVQTYCCTELLLYRDTDTLALRAAPGLPNLTCRDTCRGSVSKNNPLTAISHRDFSFFIHYFNPNVNIMIVAKL